MTHSQTCSQCQLSPTCVRSLLVTCTSCKLTWCCASSGWIGHPCRAPPTWTCSSRPPSSSSRRRTSRGCCQTPNPWRRSRPDEWAPDRQMKTCCCPTTKKEITGWPQQSRYLGDVALTCDLARRPDATESWAVCSPTHTRSPFFLGQRNEISLSSPDETNSRVMTKTALALTTALAPASTLFFHASDAGKEIYFLAQIAWARLCTLLRALGCTKWTTAAPAAMGLASPCSRAAASWPACLRGPSRRTHRHTHNVHAKERERERRKERTNVAFASNGMVPEGGGGKKTLGKYDSLPCISPAYFSVAYGRIATCTHSCRRKRWHFADAIQ